MDDLRVTRVAVRRMPGGSGDDLVAVEEPLEIRVGDRPVSVTMRTPGEDYELAAGFLFTESILRSMADVETIRHWGSPNVVRVALREGVRTDLQRLQRHFYSTSSCGVCGKTSIDALRSDMTALEEDGPTISAAALLSMPERLRAMQPAFASTGAIHGAGAFSTVGELIAAREDIGRHNAVDKVIGSLLLSDRRAAALIVSGRTSFEIVQKCVVARIPLLAAVGAPSSLAIDLAREFNLTLVGFIRDGRFNIYSGGQRIEDLTVE